MALSILLFDIVGWCCSLNHLWIKLWTKKTQKNKIASIESNRSLNRASL